MGAYVESNLFKGETIICQATLSLWRVVRRQKRFGDRNH